jgi:hypothetical protein
MESELVVESMRGLVPDFRDLAPDVEIQHLTWAGIIAESPTNFAQPITVILPEWDQHLEWGPCYWQPRDAVTLPIKGNECLVIFDSNRAPWIVAWWPFSG